MDRLLLILTLLFIFSLKAQNPQDFNDIYTKTFIETSQKDFQKALQVADSLFHTSETPLYRVKSLMLSASLHQQSGDLKKAIDFALRSEQIISQTNDYVWISRVYGFLATQYRLSGLYNPSQKYAQLAIDSAKKIKNQQSQQNILAFLQQEMAYTEINRKNYRKALEYLHSARIYFEKIQVNRDYLIAQNEQIMGNCHLNMGEYDSAMYYFDQALKSYKDLPDNHTNGLIHNGIARVYLAKENLESAKKHLDIAKTIADASNYLELKNEVYKTSQDYFLAVKDLESLSKSRVKQDSVKDKIEKKKSLFLNDSFSEINHENSQIKKNISTKNKLLILVIIVLSGGLIYFLIYRKNQNTKIKRIEEILENISKKSKQITPEVEKFQDEEQTTEPVMGDSAGSIMPASTEEKILKKLSEFEKSILYTQNNISLSFLATFCETNTKYLSFVINTHKKQDFNNYINELRINYIIQKLNDDPLYRRYKIATLAEEAGFSSQNKFATIFKKVTTISPSSFIQYLEKEESSNVLR